MARLAAVGASIVHKALPDITLRLVACRPPVDLPSGVPTVSLWFEATPRENEFAIVLGEAAYAVYARRDADVEALPLLSHRNEDGSARAPDRWAMRQPSAGQTAPLVASDSMLLREAVRAGLGKALLPMCLASEDPSLMRLGEGAPDLVRPLHLHVHPDILQFTRVQNLIDVLRQKFSTIFGAGGAIAPTATRNVLPFSAYSGARL